MMMYYNMSFIVHYEGFFLNEKIDKYSIYKQHPELVCSDYCICQLSSTDKNMVNSSINKYLKFLAVIEII